MTNRDQFLDNARVAVVGASNNKRKFGYTIYRTLKAKDFPVVPVNPNTTTIDSDTAYPRLTDIPHDIQAAIIVVQPDKAIQAVHDAKAKGITRLWFQQGADFSEAEQLARESGIDTASGKCILMYAKPVNGIHAVHRFLVRLFGQV
ncbi:CoA-binding protein [candidate division GN15 bacterium]|nr:CoA-binding protein [candidate division GN15 bacterium]